MTTASTKPAEPYQVCDAAAQHQQGKEIYKHMGSYEPFAARRNETGGSMGLAL